MEWTRTKREYERWLDEGRSPVRIIWNIVSAVALLVVAVGYTTHPHHLGAVWWVVGAVGVIAAWALAEVLRWREKYQRAIRLANSSPVAISDDALAEEAGRIAKRMTDYLAEQGRMAPLTAPTLHPPGVDHDAAWRDDQRRRMEHEKKTIAGFRERFDIPLATVCHDLEARGVFDLGDRQKIEHLRRLLGMGIVHDIDQIPAMLAAKARQLGWAG